MIGYYEKNNYNKFLLNFKKFPDKYQIVLPLTDDVNSTPRITKIYDKETCIKDFGINNYEGVFIYAFVDLSYKYESILLNKIYMKKYNIYSIIFELKNGRLNNKIVCENK